MGGARTGCVVSCSMIHDAQAWHSLVGVQTLEAIQQLSSKQACLVLAMAIHEV